MVRGFEAALQTLWDGLCTVTVRRMVINKQNGRNEPQEVVTVEDAPCRLSYKTVSTAGEQDHAATAQQTVKLLLSNEWDVPPGSKITVTQHGNTVEFAWSGLPARYSHHQEILLQPFRGWA